MTALVSLSISTLLYIGYVIWAILEFGYFPAISNTYYLLEEKFGEGKGRYFSAWISMICLFTTIPLFVATWGCWFNVFTLPILFGLLIVGIVPEYLGTSKYWSWHACGAGIAALMTIIVVCCLGYWSVLIISLIISMVINFKTSEQDLTTWLENTCFISLFTTLFYVLI